MKTEIVVYSKYVSECINKFQYYATALMGSSLQEPHEIKVPAPNERCLSFCVNCTSTSTYIKVY